MCCSLSFVHTPLFFNQISLSFFSITSTYRLDNISSFENLDMRTFGICHTIDDHLGARMCTHVSCPPTRHT